CRDAPPRASYPSLQRDGDEIAQVSQFHGCECSRYPYEENMEQRCKEYLTSRRDLTNVLVEIGEFIPRNHDRNIERGYDKNPPAPAHLCDHRVMRNGRARAIVSEPPDQIGAGVSAGRLQRLCCAYDTTKTRGVAGPARCDRKQGR